MLKVQYTVSHSGENPKLFNQAVKLIRKRYINNSKYLELP
uniref:Uncharacterized protein n=1 Tax=Wolbachia endosymbiont of Aleurodicus dispersus TaxID=1288877 RepID=A0A3B0JDE6_9RICK